MADGVGDQLAEQQFHGERGLVEFPVAQLPKGRGTDFADEGRIGGQVPGGDPPGVQSVGAGDQQRDVVAGMGGRHGVQDRLTRLLRRALLVGQDPAQLVEDDIDVAVPVLDEPVGVQDELAALGEVELGCFEGQPPEAERRPLGKVGEGHGAVRGDQRGRRVGRAGHGAALRGRVVYRVQAGRPDDPGAARLGMFPVQAHHDVVEVGEDFVRGEVEFGEAARGRTQTAHGRGGEHAVTDDVTDEETDPGA